MSEGIRGPWEKLRWYLAGFVLCYFVLGVLFAIFAFAVGSAGLRNIDLEGRVVSIS